MQRQYLTETELLSVINNAFASHENRQVQALNHCSGKQMPSKSNATGAAAQSTTEITYRTSMKPYATTLSNSVRTTLILSINRATPELKPPPQSQARR